jgi:MFS transporter
VDASGPLPAALAVWGSEVRVPSAPPSTRPVLRREGGLSRSVVPPWVIVLGCRHQSAGHLPASLHGAVPDLPRHAPVTAGLVLTVYGAGAIVGVLAGGRLVGPRWTVLTSILATAAAVAPLPYGGSTWLVFILSAVAGASAQLFRPAGALVLTSDTHARDAVGVMGIYRFSINVAGVIGPLLGGFVFPWSPSSVFVIDAVTSLCFAAVACVELPRRRPKCPEEVTVTDVSGHRPSVLRDAFASLRLRNPSPVSWRSSTSLPCPSSASSAGGNRPRTHSWSRLTPGMGARTLIFHKAPPLPRQGALSPFECAQQLDAEAWPTAALRRSCHALSYPSAFRGFLARGGC